MIDEVNQYENVQGSASDSSESAVGATDATSLQDTATGDAAIDPTLATTPINDDPSTPSLETVQADVVDQTSTSDSSTVLGEKDNEIKLLKSQLEERTSQCVRIAADFDNYRKRTQREREDLELQVKCSTINEILPVVDNFERARSQIKPQTEQETTIHKSYQSVYKQLVDCLKRIGVAPMRSEGKEFDPSLHEAVMRQPTDEQPEGTVMEELVRGYMLGERVLRHALVKVAAAPEPVITSEETDQGGAEN
ncbi:MAG: nucleotide exchange factor GrpE [Stenomitos rutilans HA7619-LM2]|jgi:molecular chaperone GrpE|nr:nucleotide exchange factor GrpE [Stenomitos rutilans HA7619-LM2]